MMWDRGIELWRERRRAMRPPEAPATHARAAVQWLCAAQDAGNDRGVSHSYLIGERWMRSYPETTGYIIPTLLNWGRHAGEAEAESRALEMADWELERQLPDGAIPELTGGRPTVFDTGQVIFGWVAAYRHTGAPKYLEAAQRGGQWLLEQLDSTGVWRHAGDAGGAGRVYNARVAWALLELAAAAHDDRYEAPMRRFLQWTLEQERTPGWYDRNCLTDDNAPLLHTIAYTAQGQLESGRLLQDPRLVDAARVTARQVMARIGKGGHLAGRFDRSWAPTVGWACLTGMAQCCIVWRRLATLADQAQPDAGGDEGARFNAAAERVSEFLMRTQDRSASHPGLYGGIRGSYPVNGAYGRWSVLNWATKFFVDALMAGGRADSFIYQG